MLMLTRRAGERVVIGEDVFADEKTITIGEVVPATGEPRVIYDGKLDLAG